MPPPVRRGGEERRGRAQPLPCGGRYARPRRSVPIEEVARATSTRRAVAGAVQIRLKTALTGEDYVKRKACLDATAQPCP